MPEKAMRAIHGYLSRAAQSIDPSLLVTFEQADDGDVDWRIVKAGDGETVIGLGDNYGAAHQAIRAWQHAQRATRRAP